MPNLVGIGLSQVPTNSMLGGLAYQDPEHASIKDLDLKNLSQINSETADTATDIFVYDTRKDSDGGAWRKRTQHTSWYNETLNTSTRGSRREFPAVAVIVAEQNFIKIYDGDDPDLPMWMVFNTIADGVSQGMADRPMVQVQNTDKIVYALNGILATGTKNESSNYGQPIINFINEVVLRMDSQGGEGGRWLGNIAQRNEAIGYQSVDYDYVIAASRVNDIAMTVLPNAPIDDTTGLPVPTIAVATDDGVSVIKDDGTVVDHTDSAGGESTQVTFTQDGKLAHSHDGHTGIRIDSLKSSDFTYGSGKTARHNSEEFYINYGLISSGWSGNRPKLNTGSFNSGGQIVPVQDNILAERADTGLNLLARDFPDSPNNNRVAYATTSYNTGWMHGDIKGAFLSDTTVESLTANTNLATSAISNGTNRLTSETYDSGDTSWQMVDNAGTNNGYVKIEFTNLVVGQSYIVSSTWDNNAALDSGYQHRIQHKDGTGSENVTNFTHWNKTNGSSETLTGVFIAQTTNNDNLLIYANGITLNVSNFNVRAVDDEDRSVNNKGLAVYGTVTKSAVATGAELVAYSGFSASNYLFQPYNSDLQYGSGDFYVMAWAKLPPVSSSFDVIFDRASSTSTGRIFLYAETSNSIARILIHNGTSQFLADGPSMDDNIWHQLVGVRRGDTLSLYFDGEHKQTVTCSGSINDTNAFTHIGLQQDGATGDFGGSIALVRTGGSAPSAEQIKKMYEDEKVLFQENAKATLYGSSDAVTALAYDDSNNVLHVGTSAGRSEFQGLRRINNTTEAVTTAISASNGLVAEQ